jgi:hypothetical protein
MDLVAIAILVLIALSVIGIVAMARRRAWNADGSDDARRRGPDDGPNEPDKQPRR